MDMEKIGSYAFLAGVLVAIATAFVVFDWTATLLVVLGVIVGLLNISDKEIQAFLIAAIALIVAGSADLSSLPVVGQYLTAILGNLVVFVAPAAIVAALKAVYDIASEK